MNVRQIYPDPMPGVIRNREHIRQIKNFVGLKWGTITPTDIDFALEYRGRLFIFGELKFKGASLGLGQTRLLERLVQSCSRTTVPYSVSYAFVAEHECDPATDIPVANCLIRDVYGVENGWVPSVSPLTVWAFVDVLMRRANGQ